jgi:hypothetical protein
MCRVRQALLYVRTVLPAQVAQDGPALHEIHFAVDLVDEARQLPEVKPAATVHPYMHMRGGRKEAVGQGGGGVCGEMNDGYP